MKNIILIKTEISNFKIDVNINLNQGINCFLVHLVQVKLPLLIV